MQRLNYLLCVVVLGTVCGASASQTVSSPARLEQPPLTQQQWEKRVEATADDPR